MSVIVAPSASLMNRGVPPTDLNALTGELTPPGINFDARPDADREFSIERWREDCVLPSFMMPSVDLRVGGWQCNAESAVQISQVTVQESMIFLASTRRHS
jgi:hypothetical protein